MSFWRQVFEDDNGNPSSTRILVAGVVAYCVLASTLILSIWAYLSLTSMTFIPLGVGEVGTLAASVLAILFKVVSKKFEDIEVDIPENEYRKPRRRRDKPQEMEPTMFREVQNEQE